VQAAAQARGMLDGTLTTTYELSLFYQTERNMIAVCQGTKSKNDMIAEGVDQYKDMFIKARANLDKVIAVMINISCMGR
jgi:hypothetical protein